MHTMKLPALHLHVKTEYFNAIKRGEKTEEYRLQNAFWEKRLLEPDYSTFGYKPREFASIIIYNAYKAGGENRLRFPWRGLTINSITHPHFGPDEVTVFAIKLYK